jgi:flagellin
MADVVLTSALRSNLQALQLTQSLIDSTQLKLSTGKKVNSALDDPRSYFAAQTLSNRATDLTRLLDGIGQSIQTVKAADKGVTGVTTLIEQAEALANTAAEEVQKGGAQAGLVGDKDLRGITDFTTGTTNVDADDVLTFSFVDANGDAVNLTDGDAAGGTATTYSINFEALGGTDDDHDVVSVSDLVNALGRLNDSDESLDLVEASLNDKGQLDVKVAAGYSMRVVFNGGGANTAVEDQSFAQELGFGAYVKDIEAADQTSANANRIAITASTNASLQSYQFTDTNGDVATRNTALGSLRWDDLSTQRIIGNEAADNLQITVRTKTGSKTFSDVLGSTALEDATIGALVDAVNADSTNGLKDLVKLSFDEETGQISIKPIDEDVVSVKIGVLSDGNTTAKIDFGFGNLQGASITAGATANNIASENIVFARGAGRLASLEQQFDSLLSQIDGLVDDSGYAGVNLLDGQELVTYFNEDRTSKLVTKGQSLKYGDLGLDSANFGSSEKVSDVIDKVKTALDTVREFGSLLANDLSIIQTRESFTKGLVETLSEGSDKLTLADQNEEGAKLLSLQTRQQLGVTALSLAAQSQQAILRLF